MPLADPGTSTVTADPRYEHMRGEYGTLVSEQLICASLSAELGLPADDSGPRVFAGAITGLFCVGLGLLGATTIVFIFQNTATSVLIGFGFGAGITSTELAAAAVGVAAAVVEAGAVAAAAAVAAAHAR